jgi:CIC family chloride channel protein
VVDGVAPVSALRLLGREHRIAALAAVTGAIAGLCVALFDRLVAAGMVDRVIGAPLAVQLAAPAVGLALAALAVAHLGGSGPGGGGTATADEYIRNFHERDRRMPLRPVLGRLVASACTLGSGCPMGLEGPSIYLGAAVGTTVQRRLSRWFRRDEAKVLLVAGAAAGVAAIFKAPATGALFALEVPFQADLARRMLLPSLFSAAAGYLVFVAVNGTTPLFPVAGTPALGFRDLAAAAAVGLLAGAGARGFSWLVLRAKARAATTHPAVRVVVAGGAIAGLIALSRALTGETLALGPGYRTIAWTFSPRHALAVVVAMAVVRGAATVAAVGGGGVGGLFVPLAIEGALVGRTVGGVVGHPGAPLYPLLGVAAFLGAGYRVPLAAVMFVAESTGKPGFVVPGLIAAALSQLTMGPRSVSPYQRQRRAGHLEGRLDLPLTSVLRTDAATVPPDATLADLYAHHLLGVRLLSVPVVDGTTYVGTVHAEDLAEVPRDRWAQATVGSVARRDEPVADLGWTLGRALATLEAADTDRLPVLDGGAYVGLVTTGEILKLEEILERTLSPPGDDR